MKAILPSGTSYTIDPLITEEVLLLTLYDVPKNMDVKIYTVGDTKLVELVRKKEEQK